MRLSQRVVVGAAAAASVVGGMGAALAADQTPNETSAATADTGITSVVLDTQAAAKKRLRVTWADRHGQIDQMLERISRAQGELTQAQREQKAAAVAAAVAAAAVPSYVPAPASSPTAVQQAQPATTHATTGASGATATAEGDDRGEGNDD